MVLDTQYVSTVLDEKTIYLLYWFCDHRLLTSFAQQLYSRKMFSSDAKISCTVASEKV